VKDILEEDQVVERLKATLVKAVVSDRRKHPSYGYRAVHIIARARNRPIEIQVRTELQHLWAQLSERLSDALGSAIKYGGGDPDVRKRLAEMSDLIGSFEVLESGPVAAELTERVGQLKQEIRKILENAIAS
jgi:ppGpp synthetase/RelA/SpoT-type nucleotidyltranferase